MKTRILIVMFALASLISCNTTEDVKDTRVKEKKDLSIQLYSVRKDINKDCDATLKSLADMGFTSVELADCNNGEFYGKKPKEFRASVEKLGMTILSSHVRKDISEEELKKGEFSEALIWWDACIADHKEAGAKYLVMPSMPVPKTVKDLDLYCQYYNEIGKKCKAVGIEFGYHNHSFEFVKIEDKMMYDYLLENTNPEYVFFEMDVYWVVRGQNSPVEYFNKYPGRFKLLHIKDHKEIGQSGMVGFDAIFNNTDITGVKHLIVEVERYNFEPIESIRQSIEYLQSNPLVKVKY